MTVKEQIEELARSTFEGMQEIEAEYKAAEDARRSTPMRTGVVDAEYQAKSASAEARFQKAQKAMHSMKMDLPWRVKESLAAIRREYAAEVQTRFSVDPGKLDQESLELLKSGIMKPTEYAHMMETARRDGNVTMVRLIAKYAAEAAGQYEPNDQRARELRAVGHIGNADPAAAAMSNFDDIAEVFDRTVNNPSMISYWDSLAGPMLDKL